MIKRCYYEVLSVERTANDYSPAFMIMAAAVVSFAAVLTFPSAPSSSSTFAA